MLHKIIVLGLKEEFDNIYDRIVSEKKEIVNKQEESEASFGNTGIEDDMFYKGKG